MSSISMPDILLLENASDEAGNLDASAIRITTQRASFQMSMLSTSESFYFWTCGILGIIRQWCHQRPHDYVLMFFGLLSFLGMAIGLCISDGAAWVIPTCAVCMTINAFVNIYEVVRMVHHEHYSPLTTLLALGHDEETMVYVLVNGEDECLCLDRVPRSSLKRGHVVVIFPESCSPSDVILVKLPEAKLPMSLTGHLHSGEFCLDNDEVAFRVPTAGTASILMSRRPVPMSDQVAFTDAYVSLQSVSEPSTQIRGFIVNDDGTEVTRVDANAHIPAGSVLDSRAYAIGVVVHLAERSSVDRAAMKCASPWRSSLSFPMAIPVMIMWLCYSLLCYMYQGSAMQWFLATMAYFPGAPLCMHASIKIADLISAARVEKDHRALHHTRTRVNRLAALRELSAARSSIISVSSICREEQPIENSISSEMINAQLTYSTWVACSSYTESDVKKYAVLCHLVSQQQGGDDMAQWITDQNITIRRVSTSAKHYAQFVIGMSHVQHDDVEMLYVFADEKQTPLKSMIVRINDALHIVSWGSLEHVQQVCERKGSKTFSLPPEGIPLICYATRSITEEDLKGLDLPIQELNSALHELRSRLETDMSLVGGFTRKVNARFSLEPGAQEWISALRAKKVALCFVATTPSSHSTASVLALLHEAFGGTTPFIHLQNSHDVDVLRMDPTAAQCVCVMDKAAIIQSCEGLGQECAGLLSTCAGVVICGYMQSEVCNLMASWRIAVPAGPWIGIVKANEPTTMDLLGLTDVKLGITEIAQVHFSASVTAYSRLDISTCPQGLHCLLADDVPPGRFSKAFSAFIIKSHIVKDAMMLASAFWALIVTQTLPNGWLMNVSSQVAYHACCFCLILVLGFEYAMVTNNQHERPISALKEGFQQCGRGMLMATMLAVFICISFYGQPIADGGDSLALIWSTCLLMCTTVMTIIVSGHVNHPPWRWSLATVTQMAIIAITYLCVSAAGSSYVHDVQYELLIGGFVARSKAAALSWLIIFTFAVVMSGMLMLGRMQTVMTQRQHDENDVDQPTNSCKARRMWAIVTSCLLLAGGGIFCCITSAEQTQWMRIPYGQNADIGTLSFFSMWSQPWKNVQSYSIDPLGCVVHANQTPLLLRSGGSMVYIDIVLPTRLTEFPSEGFSSNMAAMTDHFCQKVHDRKERCEWSTYHVFNDTINLYEVTSIPGTRFPRHSLDALHSPSHGLTDFFHNVSSAQILDMQSHLHDVTSSYFQWWVLSIAASHFKSIRVPLGIIPGRNKSFWLQILDNSFPAAEKTLLISSDTEVAFDIFHIGIATLALVGLNIMVLTCMTFIDMAIKTRQRIFDERTRSLTLSRYRHTPTMFFLRRE